MTKRTKEEQRVWDQIVIATAAQICGKTKKPQGCAHLVREIADAVIRERRQSAEQDK